MFLHSKDVASFICKAPSLYSNRLMFLLFLSLLAGITRQAVIDLCRSLSIPVVERRVSLAEFHSADEVFTTGESEECVVTA